MRPILQEGDEQLRKEAELVPDKLFGSEELSHIIADMTEVLAEEPDGVALAAPQIGVLYRLFIVRKDRTLPSSVGAPADKPAPERVPDIEVYINPEIFKTSRKRLKAEEGCLSVRGVYGTASRHERVSIRARRANGARFTRGGSGLMAQIFEHEIDHLNGILFIDHAEHLLRIEHTDHHAAGPVA